MANLLDALRGNNQALTQKQGQTDETQGVNTLLRAKSGKATGLSGALSNLGEQAAVDQTNQQAEQLGQAAEIQTQGQEQQARGIEQTRAGQMENVSQARQQNTLQANLQTDKLLQELEQGKGKVDQARYQAGMEQLGQNLRLQNQQYVDNLEREGSRARLDDAASFKEALARETLGDQQSFLEKQLGNKSALDATDREYQVALANMGVYDAYQMFQSAMNNEKSRAQYEGLGNIATAGIGAYGTYANSQSANSSKPLTAQSTTKGVDTGNSALASRTV